jgi:hypothetical protein
VGRLVAVYYAPYFEAALCTRSYLESQGLSVVMTHEHDPYQWTGNSGYRLLVPEEEAQQAMTLLEAQEESAGG